jgi:hypothetical protein
MSTMTIFFDEADEIDPAKLAEVAVYEEGRTRAVIRYDQTPKRTRSRRQRAYEDERFARARK